MTRKKGSWNKSPKISIIKKFPKLPQELDRRKVLMDYDIEALKRDRKSGKYTIKQLAHKYEVSQTTVKYHTCPKYREWCRIRDKQRGKIRAIIEPEKTTKLKSDSRKYCFRVFPEQNMRASYLRREKRQTESNSVPVNKNKVK